MFNKSGKLIAAQWSMASRTWIEMGEVVGSNGGAQEEIAGVPYDVVLPVEMDTPRGPMNLKLGYNNGENPFVAAQRFIDQNELSQAFLQEIADWIIARTGSSQSQGPTIDMSAGGATTGGYQAVVGDPTKTNVSAAQSKFFPRLAMYFFDDVPAGLKGKLMNKLQEMNAGVPPEMTLSATEFDAVGNVATTLEATSRYHSSEISSSEVTALVKMIQWDAAKVTIPFDLLRMVASHPHGALTLAKHAKTPSILSRIETLVRDPTLSLTLLTVILRFLCNCFRIETLRRTLLQNPSSCGSLVVVLEAASHAITAGNKNCKAAYTSLLVNLAASLGELAASDAVFFRAASQLLVVLSSETSSADILFSAMLGIGTVIVLSRQKGKLQAELLGNLEGVSVAVQTAKSSWVGAAWSRELEDAYNELLVILRG